VLHDLAYPYQQAIFFANAFSNLYFYGRGAVAIITLVQSIGSNFREGYDPILDFAIPHGDLPLISGIDSRKKVGSKAKLTDRRFAHQMNRPENSPAALLSGQGFHKPCKIDPFTGELACLIADQELYYSNRGTRP
jgi:hypothetical protein